MPRKGPVPEVQDPVHGSPRTVIVGFGRLGGALALTLREAHVPVAVLPHSAASVRAALKAGLTLADHDWLAEADVCFLAVPDPAIGQVAAEVAPSLGPQCALVHCAGAKDLSPLAAVAPRARGSFHPLCAISARTDSLAGSTVAIAASSRRLLQILSALVKRLGLRSITVDESARAAYHAGAVLSAGGVVALADAAVKALETAGIGREDALAALLPLMRSAVAGLERRGLPDALTGPVPRGDSEVVAQHLATLPEDVKPLYRLLMQRSLALATPSLSSQSREALAQVLVPTGTDRRKDAAGRETKASRKARKR
jgi:predicted short-subunit dehydrogenase-like oxidoreductase (DUF2520 family)